MKTREEVEEQLKEMTAPSGQAAAQRTLFDLLLDIRELLMRQEHTRRQGEFVRARKMEELKRLMKSKQQIDKG